MKPTRETVVWSWLHISDIHFGHGGAENVSDQAFVLAKLVDDLQGHSARAVSPQAVLITGDVGFTGGKRDPGEYQSALDYMDQVKAKIGNLPVFVVPGNHDVQRAETRGFTLRLLEALRAGTTAGELDDVLKASDEADLLHARFSGYDEFVAKADATGDSRGWTRDITGADGRPIRILGWNTALLSNDDSDEGKLTIHHSAVDSALTDVPEGAVVVALSHHPTNWLRDRDRKRLEGRMAGRVHIHLHGHVHAPGSRSILDGQGRQHAVITAGAAHGERDRFEQLVPFHYSIGAIVATQNGPELRVWPRKWSDRWTLDVDTVPDDRSYAAHPLYFPRTTGAKADAASDADTEEPHRGVALLDPEDNPLLAVTSASGPQLVAADAARGRTPALMSAEGGLLASVVGGSLRLAWTDQSTAGCTNWGSPVPLDPDEVVLAIALAGKQDVLLVTASSGGSRLRLANPAAPAREVMPLDDRPAKAAVLINGRVLLAWENEGQVTCEAIPGIDDLRGIEIASSGGSDLVLGFGADPDGKCRAFLIHGDRIRDLGYGPTPVLAIPLAKSETPRLMRMPEYERISTASDADRVHSSTRAWRSLRFGDD